MYPIINVPDQAGDILEQLGTKPKFWFSDEDSINKSAGGSMAKNIGNLAKEILQLTEIEKLQLVDTILTDLDKTRP